MRNGEGDADGIPVEVWYPSSEPAEEFTVYNALEVDLPSRAYRDVPPDPTAPYFIVAFSHGLGGIRQQNMTMAERLASFGFVVVTADHPGTTTLEFLSNVGDFSEALRVRPQTVRDAVDAVYAGIVPGVVPQEGYAVVGHSLGAVTAMFLTGTRFDPELYAAGCASEPKPFECNLLGDVAITQEQLDAMAAPDPRVVTAVLQNPAGAFAMIPESVGNTPTPFLIGGTRDNPDITRRIFEMLPEDAYMAMYQDAGHNAATDICAIPIAANFSPECGGIEDGFADPETLRGLIVGHVVAWLGVHLGQQPDFVDDLGPGAGYEWTGQ